ncbi:hypothetical protein [Novosphingobium sp.]
MSERGSAWRESAIRAWLENPTLWSASEARSSKTSGAC